MENKKRHEVYGIKDRNIVQKVTKFIMKMFVKREVSIFGSGLSKIKYKHTLN